MLRDVIFLIFCFKNIALADIQFDCNACQEIENLRKESLQKIELLQKDPTFQEMVKDLQRYSLEQRNTAVNSIPKTQHHFFDANLYIFVSFSMGEKALLNLAYEAKRFGATLVLRGFKDGSYRETMQAMQKIILKTGQGVLIDPELYSLFEISAVPTFILTKPFPLQAAERTQTPLHDKLQGHVSTRYALETFAKEGDLKEEAHVISSKGTGS